MSNLKTTLITAVTGLTVATAGLFALPSPEAQARECSYGDGYRICFDLTDKIGSFTRWDVEVTNNNTTEIMDVTCDGRFVEDWSSRGGFSQSEANELAEWFCSI